MIFWAFLLWVLFQADGLFNFSLYKAMILLSPFFFVIFLVLATIFLWKDNSFYTAILIFSILLPIVFPWALVQLVN